MTILHIPVFHGIAPRRASRKLTQAQSQTARNCELFSEELRPIKEVTQVDTPGKVGVKKSIYLLGGTWLHWLTDVDVARSPLYLENALRIHYTGDKNPKSTDDTLATASPGREYPTDFYRLGLPRPDTNPTIGTTGGTGNNIDRSYVYTFVTAWGEEGPPSPVGSVTGPSDATSWDLTAIDASPPNQWTHAADISTIAFSGTTVTVTLNSGSNHFLETTEYVTFSGTTTGTGSLYTDIIGTWQVTRTSALVFTFELLVAPTGTYTGGAVIDREAPIQTTSMVKRVYRTLAGGYRYVGETLGTTLTDTTTDTGLGKALPGGILEKDWWKAPNGNMKGIIAFPGGIQAGFYGNTLAFCEPNVPSAYPEAYRYTFNSDIVAIGVVGNMVVVATEGYPNVVTGTHPDSMAQGELEVFQSCVSKRGLVSLFNGVVYPSEDGLVYVPSVGVPQIITRDFFKKKDWSLFNPSELVSGVFDDRYYGFYVGGGESGAEGGALIFDPKEPGGTFTTLGLSATAVHSDLESDDFYLMQDDVIAKYDAGGSFLTYTWLSKLFTTKNPLGFTAAKIKLTIGDGVPVVEQTAAIAAAITSLELILSDTVANSGTFGAANNYVSGSLGGGAVADYAFAGGPYYAAVAGITGSGQEITANMKVYAWFDTGSGSITRNLVHTENLSGSKPFRLGNVIKGFLSDQWEIEFNCNDVIIHEALLGTTVRELAKV